MVAAIAHFLGQPPWARLLPASPACVRAGPGCLVAQPVLEASQVLVHVVSIHTIGGVCVGCKFVRSETHKQGKYNNFNDHCSRSLPSNLLC
jgi:hypothetical protein